MKFKTISIFTFLFFLFIESAFAENCTDKFCFKDKISYKAQNIELYNYATFKFLFFRVYTLALYKENQVGISSVENQESLKALTFYFHRSVEKEALTKGARDVLVDNPTVKYDDFKSEIKKLNSFIRDITQGDSFTILHDPNVGLSLIYQEQTVVTIKNPEFSNVYFSIWLSKWSVSNHLRQKLFSRFN